MEVGPCPLVEWDASAYVTTGSTCCAARCLQWENAKIQRTCRRSGRVLRSPLGVGRLGLRATTGLKCRVALRLQWTSSQRNGVRSKGVDVCLRPSRGVGRIGVCDDWVDVPYCSSSSVGERRKKLNEYASRSKGVDGCLVPFEGWDTSVYVTIGSTCCAAPRLKWDSGGSLQWPGHVEQPAPRERTQIPVATQVLKMAVLSSLNMIICYYSSLWNRMRNQNQNHHMEMKRSRYRAFTAKIC